jgi:hypothetical protein
MRGAVVTARTLVLAAAVAAFALSLYPARGFAQECVADVVASVDLSGKATTFIMKSGAVYRELLVEDDEYDSPFEPAIGSGNPLFICGDHMLLHVFDPHKECHAGMDCEAAPIYTLIPVKCLRRCLRH